MPLSMCKKNESVKPACAVALGGHLGEPAR